MGGRGGSSVLGAGGSSGLDVTKDGQTTQYYFAHNNGVNYYQSENGGTPEPTPMNMSAGEFKQRLEHGGAVTRVVARSERSKDERVYKTDREETNRFLDREIASNRALSSGSRADAKVNPVNLRKEVVSCRKI